VAALAIVISAAAAPASAQQTFAVRGKVLWPGDRGRPALQPCSRHDACTNLVDWHAEEETSAAKIKLILSTHGVPQKYAWPQPDGAFVFHGVPAGSHMLDLAAINVIYPQASPGAVHAL
jgi:hypothetical protein